MKWCRAYCFTTGLPCEHPAKYYVEQPIYFMQGSSTVKEYLCGIHARGIPKDKLVKIEKESK